MADQELAQLSLVLGSNLHLRFRQCVHVVTASAILWTQTQRAVCPNLKSLVEVRKKTRVVDRVKQAHSVETFNRR